MILMKFSHWLYTKHITWGGRLFEIISMMMNSNAISCQAIFGEGTKLYHHGLGCCIHENTVIGKNCCIFQNVTIGQTWSKKHKDGVPKIGNNVLIGTGAVLLGNINIGNDCVIGANAVVLKDMPDNSIALGVPAQIKLKGE